MLWFAATNAFCIYADDWPVIFPCYRLHVGDSSVHSGVLKMNKPFFAGRSVYKSALVRSVDVGGTLVQDNFFFVRTIKIFGTEYGLPTVFYASGRSKNVIVAVFLIKLWTFDGRICFCTIIEECIIADGAFSVRSDLENAKNTVETNAALGITMDNIGSTVIIPDRAWVDVTLTRQD